MGEMGRVRAKNRLYRCLLVLKTQLLRLHLEGRSARRLPLRSVGDAQLFEHERHGGLGGEGTGTPVVNTLR